jgi:hypothetical protein
LRGRIEVDETYVGGVEEDVDGRQIKNKAIVVIAAEEAGGGIGRIRLACVPDVGGECLPPSPRRPSNRNPRSIRTAGLDTTG